MTPPTAVFTATVIDGQVDHLNEQLPDFLGHPARTATDSLELLAAVRATRQKLLNAEQALERDAARRMPERTLEWPGGRAERRRSWNWTWLDDDLARAVVREVLVDRETGELPSDPHTLKLASDLVSAFCNCARLGWRSTQLELLGIDVGEYRTGEPGRSTVQVTLAENLEQAS